jgi:hypothetical protein
MEKVMFKVIVLLCATRIAGADCGADQAQAVIALGTTPSLQQCMARAQTRLAAQDAALPRETYIKIVCAHESFNGGD